MPGESDKITCHILICVFQSWGHYKLAIGFACKLLQERPSGLLITFISAGKLTELSKTEVDNNFLHRDSSSKQNLCFVHLGGKGMSFPDLRACLLEKFPSYCSTMFTPGKPIESLDGFVYTNPRKPDIFICDAYWPELCKTFREIPGCTASILTWIALGTGGFLRDAGPESLGGLGDVPAQAKLLAAENNKTLSEMEIELRGSTKGKVHHLFGGIDMFDYEQVPQGHNLDPLFPQFVYAYNQAYRMFMDTDGSLFTSNAVFEPEATKACRKWCSKRGKSCFTVGPFTAEDDQLETIKHQSESDDMIAKIVGFMDKVYASHGAHSLILLSFGTLYSPNAQTLYHVLRVILELNIPLIFLYESTRQGEMPPDLKAELYASSIVHVSPWAPQELILNHKATGWFVTHCGLGGVSEAIFHSVPMIAWPIHVDQPYHTAYCTLKLDIAYELLEVRTVEGLRPLHRGARPTGTTEAIIEEARTVLTNAFGEDCKRKRNNVEKLRDKMGLLWKEGGDSLKDTRGFISEYIPTKA